MPLINFNWFFALQDEINYFIPLNDPTSTQNPISIRLLLENQLKRNTRTSQAHFNIFHLSSSLSSTSRTIYYGGGDNFIVPTFLPENLSLIIIQIRTYLFIPNPRGETFQSNLIVQFIAVEEWYRFSSDFKPKITRQMRMGKMGVYL